MLSSMGMKGTFYVDLGNPRGVGLTEVQLQDIALNHEVGSHTWTHVNLKKCAPIVIRRELRYSKVEIEKITRQPVFGIAYTWGLHTPTVRRIARDCGYLFGRTVEEGQVGFPPKDQFAWGISVQALPRPRLLSRKAHRYITALTGDWRKLALRFFQRAYETRGVWHIFGHAWEVLQRRGLKDEFIRICRDVALRKDVWHATNGMLFVNEINKKHARILVQHHPDKSIFRIKLNRANDSYTSRVPLPLRLIPRKDWGDKFRVDVKTSPNGRVEMGKLLGTNWIDLHDSEAEIEIAPA